MCSRSTGSINFDDNRVSRLFFRRRDKICQLTYRRDSCRRNRHPCHAQLFHAHGFQSQTCNRSADIMHLFREHNLSCRIPDTETSEAHEDSWEEPHEWILRFHKINKIATIRRKSAKLPCRNTPYFPRSHCFFDIGDFLDKTNPTFSVKCFYHSGIGIKIRQWQIVIIFFRILSPVFLNSGVKRGYS